MRTHIRSLSSEGEKEFGHIFKAGIPCQQLTPVRAHLEGLDLPQEVFLVDWKCLSEDQQSLALQYMEEKFGVPQPEIRQRIQADGHFPIRREWVIESYDMRLVM